MTKDDALHMVDWTMALSAPRYAGGHEEVMGAIFGSKTKVIAEWHEDDYQGSIAFAYEFDDGTVGIVTDSFGSCSGCDSWEAATDVEARNMITEIVTSMRLFKDKDSAREYCKNEAGKEEEYTFRAASNLVIK